MKAESILKYTIYAGVFALLFIPLLVSDSMFFPYITGKNFTFRIIVEIIFGAWIALAIYKPQYRPQFSWILTALGAFVAWVLVSALLGVNTEHSIWSNFERMEGWITLIHLLGLFIVVGSTFPRATGGEKIWLRLFWTSSVVAIIAAVLGIAEVGEETRVDASLGNPIYLAGYLLVHIFLVGWLVFDRVQKKTQETHARFKDFVRDPWIYVGVVAVILYLVGIWFTGTRGSIVGLGAGVFVMAVIVAWRAKHRPRLRNVAGIGVLAVILVAGGIFLARDTQLVQDTPVIGRFSDISLEEGTGGSRLDLWGMALQGTADRPVFGWGTGNFSYVFSVHYDTNMYDDEEWFDRTHNVFFEWLVTAGVPGLLLYISLFVALIFYIWRNNETQKEEEGIFDNLSVIEKALLTGLLVAYAVHNFFVFDNIVSYLLFALLLALFHARGARNFKNESFYKPIPTKAGHLAGILVGLVIVASIWVINVRGIEQAQGLVTSLRLSDGTPMAALEEFERTIPISPIGRYETRERLSMAAGEVAENDNAPLEAKQEFLNSALPQMEEEIESHGPLSVRPRVFTGLLLVRFDQFEQAIEYLEEAHDINSKKQSINWNLAAAHKEAGNDTQAHEYYRQAYELAPPTDRSVTLYATSLIRMGEIEQGQELLEEYFGTSSIDNPDVLRAYEEVGFHEEMIDILEERVANDPENPQAYVSLAAGYNQIGNTAEAIATLERVIELFPELEDQMRNLIEQIRAEN